MAATMQDVARYAAVSTATVSRVINHPDQVNAETRQQVMDAIKALGYRMNRTARSLRTRRTRRLALVVSNLDDPVIVQIIEGFEDAAIREHYAVQLCISHGDPSRAPFYIEMLTQQGGVDGVLWLSNHVFSSRQALDHVIEDNSVVLWVNSPTNSVIQFNYQQAASIAVNHLIESGHREIMLLVDSASQYIQEVYIAGYTQTLTAAGLPADVTRIYEINSRDDDHKSLAVIDRLLDAVQTDKTTAVVTASDRLASMVYQGCTVREICIPDDLSIIGCGDYPLLFYLNPALTTFRLPADKLGRLAFEMLDCAINDAESFEQPLLLDPELIRRNSVALIK